MRKVELVIDRLAKTGEGVARHGRRTVFVEGALPGERVRAKLQEGKVLRATVVEVLEPSPDRKEPACPLAGVCGGCTWLHLAEPAQRKAKEEIVVSSLEHLGGVGRGEYQLLPTVFGAKSMGYRRRASMHPVAGGLGFHGRRSHELVRVDRCPALVPELETLRVDAEGVQEVRLVSDRGGIGVSLHVKVVKPRHRARAEELLKLRTVQSVVLVPDAGSPVVLGDGRIRADAFAQANVEVNALLVKAVAAALDARGRTVLELYAGAGNLTRGLEGAKVTAVESAAFTPSLLGVWWIRGDAAKVTAGLLAEKTHFDRLLVDPPRAGAQGIGRWALGLGVTRVVYVACDPGSLARDAADLKQQGFVPVTLQLFDMFPQTHHVEAVMRFDKAAAPAAAPAGR